MLRNGWYGADEEGNNLTAGKAKRVMHKLCMPMPSVVQVSQRFLERAAYAVGHILASRDILDRHFT